MRLLPFLLLAVRASALQPFEIEVVDRGNGWPVSLVELTTTGNVTFVTDNAGLVAFDLEEAMGRETWLGVFSHGYEIPADGFGYRGVRFTPQPGGKLRIEIDRKQIAKRLGRLTGAGLFAESQKLGRFRDWEESGVTGCDTVHLAAYRGKLFWLWGDTNLPNYPLGIFDTSAATSAKSPLASPEPPVALRYDYFKDEKGVPRAVADLPGDGPTWLSGLVALPDRDGKERLVATYSKIEREMAAYEFGLIEWNDARKKFDHVLTFWKKSEGGDLPPAPYPDGHPVIWKDANGKAWLYLNGPPNFRCPATYEAWKDRETWEKVERPSLLKIAGGGDLEIASAALAWSGFRKKWVMIAQEKFGKPSAFGEVWYLEGETPEGPWGPAVKIATHENYTFYNIQIDSRLAPADGPVLLFEGTYTATFADRPPKTPRYDYNQILYRLDLDDPALNPARRSGSRPGL